MPLDASRLKDDRDPSKEDLYGRPYNYDPPHPGFTGMVMRQWQQMFFTDGKFVAMGAWGYQGAGHHCTPDCNHPAEPPFEVIDETDRQYE